MVRSCINSGYLISFIYISYFYYPKGLRVITKDQVYGKYLIKSTFLFTAYLNLTDFVALVLGDLI